MYVVYPLVGALSSKSISHLVAQDQSDWGCVVLLRTLLQVSILL